MSWRFISPDKISSSLRITCSARTRRLQPYSPRVHRDGGEQIGVGGSQVGDDTSA